MRTTTSSESKSQTNNLVLQNDVLGKTSLAACEQITLSVSDAVVSWTLCFTVCCAYAEGEHN